jgi:hypothetical protein
MQDAAVWSIVAIYLAVVLPIVYRDGHMGALTLGGSSALNKAERPRMFWSLFALVTAFGIGSGTAAIYRIYELVTHSVNQNSN